MTTIKQIATKAAFPVLIVVFTLSLYIATLLPGVSSLGDESKFQFMGKILGIPHATGFPTYVLLNWLFVHLVPLKSIAWRVNLMSAVFASGTCLVLYFLLLKITRYKLLSFLTAILFSLTHTFWAFSVLARVYTLNLFFFCLVIFLLLKWQSERKNNQLYLALIIYSVSLGGHPTIILLLPAIIYIILVTDPKIFLDKRMLWVCFCMFMIVGLLYSYIPIRFHQRPLYQEGNVRTFADFFRYVTGDYWREEMFNFSMQKIPSASKNIFVDLLRAEFYSPIVIGLGIIGILSFLWEKTRLCLFLLLTVAPMIVWVILSDYGALYFRYLLPVSLIFAIFIGLGFSYPLRVVRSGRIRKGIYFIAVLLLLLNNQGLAKRNYHLVDRSKDTEMKETIEKTLRYIGDNAMILSGNYDYFEAFNYYLFIEDEWKDKNIRLLMIFLGESVKFKKIPQQNRQWIYQEEIHKSQYKVPLNLPIYTFSHFPDLELKKVLNINDEVDLYQVIGKKKD